MASAGGTRVEFEVDDALCRRCGKCCYKKVIEGKRVYITPFPCKHLDPNTNLCSIFQERHRINRLCLSVPQGLRCSAFPADCPYVAAHAEPGYEPAREDFDMRKHWYEFDVFAKDMGVAPHVRDLVRARGPDAPPMYAEVWQRQHGAAK
jgi:hypothetical protein